MTPMSSSVEQVKERLNIADIVGAYVTLERAGRNFRSRCPFHNERTPSFFVSVERGTYHCCGCGKGGDIFSFVEEFEGVDFYGALKILAAKAGVELPRNDPRANNEKEALYRVMEEATLFYQRTLASSPAALRYLASRGLTAESIRDWRIGFAPNEWRSLLSFFSSRGGDVAALVRAGLVVRTADGKHYDRFRGRIMFPIADRSGRSIAFSARLFTEGGAPRVEAKPVSAEGFGAAKYINSPETPLYTKSSALYGLDKAKQHIRANDSIVVVEGQMDVVMTHQVGIKHAVATSGTALSEDHLARIRRFTDKIIFSFDADEAGVAATERALKMALALGMEASLVRLPAGKDPADVALAAPDELRERMRKAEHAVDFFLAVILENYADARRRKIETGKRVLPLIAAIKNRIEQAHFVAETARRMAIREETLWEELRTFVPGNAAQAEVAPRANAPRSRQENIIERLAGIFLRTGEVGATHEPFLAAARAEFESVLEMPWSEFIGGIPAPERERILFEAEVAHKERPFAESDVKELLRNLKEGAVRARITERTAALPPAGRARGGEENPPPTSEKQ